MRLNQRGRFLAAQQGREHARPVDQTADEQMQRSGGGEVDHTAGQKRLPGLTVLGLNLRIADTDAEIVQRHTDKPRSQQERQSPTGVSAAQVGFPQEKPAVARIGRDDAQAKIAHEHEQRAKRS